MNSKEGSRLLSSRMDWFAQHIPTKSYASIPKDDSDCSRGYRDVSYGVFTSAIDEASRWLDSRLSSDLSDKTDHPFTYYGPIDLRWMIFVVAAIKTGRKILLASAHASISSVQHLYASTQCSTMIHANTDHSRELAGRLVEGSCVRGTLIAPELADLLENQSSETYPYAKTFEIATDVSVAILHSSGTTNLPKPLYYMNRMVWY